MQCINKIKAGYTRAGDLTFSKKNADPSIIGFELECRKCLPCRLNIAREKSIRAIHESQMHKESIFLTLTYAPEHLKSKKLNYLDFQLFMKSLRELITRDITDKELREKLSVSYMVTGEYGDKNKRPHWHAIIFNYRPPDAKPKYTSDLGHDVFKSEILTNLWKKGTAEFGSVTIESAGYVARYAAKKLTHGRDEEHDYHPIHKTSSRRAIGRSWIEKHYEYVFSHGHVNIPKADGPPIKAKIPRYYVDWLKKHKPEHWEKYIAGLRIEMQEKAAEKSRKEELEYLSECLRVPNGGPRPLQRKQIQLMILNQKFKRLQEKLKI